MIKRALVVIGLCSTSLAAQDGRMIRGSVTDTAGRPIAFANIMTTAQSKYAADSAGQFSMRAPGNGEITLRFYRIGYSPKLVSFTPSGDTTVAVALEPIPRVLEVMEISSTRLSRRLEARGFYQRLNDRKKGLGSASYFTPDDIEARNPLMISEMLREVPGVRVVPTGSAHRDFAIRGPSNCEYSIYVDGTRVAPTTAEVQTASQGMSMMGGAPPRRNSAASSLPVDALITPNATAGIEVYPRGAGSPPQYPKVGSTCGVVLFWSK